MRCQRGVNGLLDVEHVAKQVKSEHCGYKCDGTADRKIGIAIAGPKAVDKYAANRGDEDK